MTTRTNLADIQHDISDIEREVARRRKEYVDREFGPDSDAARKYEEAIWGAEPE